MGPSPETGEGRLHVGGRGRQGAVGAGRKSGEAFNVYGGAAGLARGAGVFGDLTPVVEDLRDPYRQEPWVNRCVNLIANALTLPQLKLYTGNPKDVDNREEVDENHPAAKLLADVNPLDDAADMQTVIGQGLSLPGEAFIMLDDAQGRPVGEPGDGPAARIALPATLNPRIGGERQVRHVIRDGVLKGWEVNRGKTAVLYPPSAVVQIKYRDPAQSLRGLGPTAAAFGHAAQLWFARRYQSATMRNGGDPGGVIEFALDQIPHQDEIDRIEAEVEARWNSPDRAGETRTVWGGKYNPHKATPRDMQYVDLTKDARNVIAAVYGVPPALLGEQAQNYATFKGHLRVFWTLTILPILQMIERAWNSRFFPRITDAGVSRMRVAFDLSAVEALQGNLLEQAEAVAALQATGVPLNTALQIAGIDVPDEIEGGEVPLIAVGMQPLVMAGMVAPVTPPAEEGEDDDEDDDDPDPEPDDGGGGDDKAQPFDPATIPDAMPVLTTAGKLLAPVSLARSDAVRDDETPDSVVDTVAQEARRDRYKAVQSKLDPIERSTTNKIKAVYRDMRAAQLAELDRIAADGVAPSKARVSIYPSPTPSVSQRGLHMLDRAVVEDFDEARLMEVPQVAIESMPCCGEQSHRVTPHRPRLDAWRAQRPELDDVPDRRLIDLAMLVHLKITEADIDATVAALDASFEEAWASALAKGLDDTVAVADKGVQGEIASALFDGTDSAVVQALRDKAVKLAEGEMSEVAQRVRSAILEALKESSAPGTVADQIAAALADVKAVTREEFNKLARRARTIARTELGQASGIIRSERIAEAGRQGLVSSREWLASVPQESAPPYEAGGFVRREHWSMDGQTAVLGEPWHMPDGSLLRHPKDPAGAAHQIINCKCHESPLLNESDPVADTGAPQE